MGALDLIAKAAKGAKKTAPFFSKADVVLDELQRGKGTGNEFLTELVKKGAKPTELKERGIERALKDKPKMTKAEVQKVFEEKAPPKVQEKVLTSDVPDYDEWLENKAQEIYGVDWFDLRKDEQSALNKMYGELPVTQYDNFKTPGGENYREILLKLPSVDTKRIMELEADIRRSEEFYRNPMSSPDFPRKLDELQRLKEEQAAAGQPYVSSHYKTDPNLLAHIRVQDFQIPTKGYAVVNARSGNKSQVFQTAEEAQNYIAQMPESLQPMLRVTEAAGTPKKVLLVDEIQSDWHQEGRKKGYQSDLQEKHKASVREESQKLNADLQQIKQRLRDIPAGVPTDEVLALREQEDSVLRRLRELSERVPDKGVPDAPFKKNWHELAMKRVLDYAAENGYDTVAITPGVQQVKRYEDATRQAVDEVSLYGDTLVGFKNGVKVIEQPISSPDELEQYIGKDMAQKLSSAAPDMNFIRSIKGEDITVGGEGMKGFYDKILPNYLNKFGSQYGSSVGEIDIITKPSQEIPQIAAPGLGHFPEPIVEPAKTMKAWSFDITPQLREEIKTKGLPLYSKMGMGPEGLAAGTGAATIGADVLSGEDEQQVQNPVHFTENPDVMRLELMQRN